MRVTNRPVLVLNKSWHPINVTTVEAAIIMVYKLRSRIIDPTKDFQLFTWEDWSKFRPMKDELSISSSHESYRLPEVILVYDYDKLPQHGANFSRRQLYKRDNYRCQYCGSRPGIEELSVDHVIPSSQGGQTTWTNCVLSCVECNRKKAACTPEQANMKLLRKPYKPKFNLLKGDRTYVPNSWKNFVSEAYWSCMLVND